MPDGRLREQLRGVPDDRLLDLTGVRFVVTDKQLDPRGHIHTTST